MRRALFPLLAAMVLMCSACSSDGSEDAPASDASIEALFDGNVCSITASDPGYVPAEVESVDLLVAAPGASLTFVVTNTSGTNLTGLVNRFDPALSAAQVLTELEALGAEDGTMYPEPEFTAGPAATDVGAEQLSLDEDQLQYHYTLQPGLSVAIVYTNDGIWPCDTSPEVISLIEVPDNESTTN